LEKFKITLDIIYLLRYNLVVIGGTAMAIPQLSNIYLKGDKCKDKNLSWANNPASQKLLDAIVSILANEYIEIAKQNPALFSTEENGGKI
jgi:hypothetical protein